MKTQESKKPKIISKTSWKGGTGKTTLGAACISELAQMGNKIIVIDLDSNLSMSRIFGATNYQDSSMAMMNGQKVTPKTVEIFGNPVDVIPSNLMISQMQNIPEESLVFALNSMDLSKYDYVFIDPPGTFDVLTRNALKSADLVIVPGMPSDIDYEAINLLLNRVAPMSLKCDFYAVLNGWDTKRNLNGILEKYQELGEFLIPTPIGAMKSLKNLTDDIFNYRLTGQAKTAIERFMIESGILEGGE